MLVVVLLLVLLIKVCPRDLYYKGLYGEVFGPYPEEQIMHWYNTGYFDDTVLITTSNSDINNNNNYFTIRELVSKSSIQPTSYDDRSLRSYDSKYHIGDSRSKNQLTSKLKYYTNKAKTTIASKGKAVLSKFTTSYRSPTPYEFDNEKYSNEILNQEFNTENQEIQDLEWDSAGGSGVSSGELSDTDISFQNSNNIPTDQVRVNNPTSVGTTSTKEVSKLDLDGSIANSKNTANDSRDAESTLFEGKLSEEEAAFLRSQSNAMDNDDSHHNDCDENSNSVLVSAIKKIIELMKTVALSPIILAMAAYEMMSFTRSKTLESNEAANIWEDDGSTAIDDIFLSNENKGNTELPQRSFDRENVLSPRRKLKAYHIATRIAGEFLLFICSIIGIVFPPAIRLSGSYLLTSLSRYQRDMLLPFLIAIMFFSVVSDVLMLTIAPTLYSAIEDFHAAVTSKDNPYVIDVSTALSSLDSRSEQSEISTSGSVERSSESPLTGSVNNGNHDADSARQTLTDTDPGLSSRHGPDLSNEVQRSIDASNSPLSGLFSLPSAAYQALQSIKTALLAILHQLWMFLSSLRNKNWTNEMEIAKDKLHAFKTVLADNPRASALCSMLCAFILIKYMIIPKLIAAASSKQILKPETRQSILGGSNQFFEDEDGDEEDDIERDSEDIALEQPLSGNLKLLNPDSFVSAAPYVQYIVAAFNTCSGISLWLLILISLRAAAPAVPILNSNILWVPSLVATILSLGTLYIHNDNAIRCHAITSAEEDKKPAPKQQHPDSNRIRDVTAAGLNYKISLFRVVYMSNLLLDPYLSEECARWKLSNYVNTLLRVELSRMVHWKGQYSREVQQRNSLEKRNNFIDSGTETLRDVMAHTNWLSLNINVLSTAAVAMSTMYCYLNAIGSVLHRQKSSCPSKVFANVVDSEHWTSINGINEIINSISQEGRRKLLDWSTQSWIPTVTASLPTKILYMLFAFPIKMFHLMKLPQQIQLPKTMTNSIASTVLVITLIMVAPLLLWSWHMTSLARLSSAGNSIAYIHNRDQYTKAEGGYVSDSVLLVGQLFDQNPLQYHSTASKLALLALSTTINETPSQEAHHSTNGLSLNSVYLSVGDEYVIKDANVCFSPGQITVILTASNNNAACNANKLLEMIYNGPNSDTVKLKAGSISMQGFDSKFWSTENWRSNIVLLREKEEKFSLQAGAVAGCVPGLSSADMKECIRAQRACGAMDVINSLPEGPGTLLNREDCGQADLQTLLNHYHLRMHSHNNNDASSCPPIGRTSLSDVQWNSLHLSRALSAMCLHSNAVVLLSYPSTTTAMTDEQEREMFDYLRSIIKTHQTVIITSTRVTTALLADKVVLLNEDGAVVEQADVKDLLQFGQSYPELNNKLSAIRRVAAMVADAPIHPHSHYGAQQPDLFSNDDSNSQYLSDDHDLPHFTGNYNNSQYINGDDGSQCFAPHFNSNDYNSVHYLNDNIIGVSDRGIVSSDNSNSNSSKK